MKSAFDYLNEYYSNYDEEHRLRSRHGLVEFHTTMRYIDRYLKPGDRVLEIGAATGRYSHALARRGYWVNAVELIEHNIELFKQNTKEGENVSIVQGNAVSLDMFESDTFDITLLLGPMYHLFTKEEQLKALKEAVRVTKPGGIIYAAYCNNDATILQYCFYRGMLKEEKYRNLIDLNTFKASSTPEELFVLYRREDIDELMDTLPVERLHYVGADMAAHYMRETIDQMDDEMFDLFLRYQDVICERQDMVGISHHILDIFRKLA